ncbi:MAG: hypothetical protein Q8Q39_04835 [bacterium]|nr:hypothetical protein [bacterium]
MLQHEAALLNKVAGIIEEDGVDGYRTATRLIGEEVANALLIAHLRRNFGSMETYPARPEIIDLVNQELAEAGILKQ